MYDKFSGTIGMVLHKSFEKLKHMKFSMFL